LTTRHELELFEKAITTKITKNEKALFEAIRDPQYNNFMLMSVNFNGKQTSCICTIDDHKDGLSITPHAVLINDKILKENKLLCPSGKETGGQKNWLKLRKIH